MSEGLNGTQDLCMPGEVREREEGWRKGGGMEGGRRDGRRGGREGGWRKEEELSAPSSIIITQTQTHHNEQLGCVRKIHTYCTV